MTRISRLVAISPVEPAPLSLRSPSEMQVTLDIQYTDALGTPITSDVAAQLQLTSRTSAQMMSYAAPAIDVVNGKARAFIPGGDLKDMNGYQLRLLGTWKSEPTLLAMGVLKLIEAAGFDAVPEDVIDDIPLYFSYNFDASVSLRLWQDTGKTTPFDTSSATITAAIYPDRNSTVSLAAFSVTTTALPGEVILTIPAATVNTLPPSGWWSLRASNAAGVTTLAQGTVTITGVKP